MLIFMLLIFIFAHFLARFLALAHTRVFLLTQRFLLSYILMKIFYYFFDLPLNSKFFSCLSRFPSCPNHLPRVCSGLSIAIRLP